MNKQDRALRNVSYGIGLQVFIGIGFIVPSLLGQELPEFMVDPRTVGGMLIMFAVNSLSYVARYKKVLREEG
jgi:hypothetical protein